MEEEKKAFAGRLKTALRSAGIEPSAAAVEKQFNSRYAGTPVTAQAISGWLTGRYIPKADKMRVLGELVGMDPHVLHYGSGKGRVAEPKLEWPVGVGPRERQVIGAFLALPPKRRELVGDLVAALQDATR